MKNGHAHRIPIRSSADIVTARKIGREVAIQLGFRGSELTVVATVISEVALNIVDHDESGDVTLVQAHEGRRKGISIVARDAGPGIADINRAMQYGYSTRNGLGVGLPGSKLLMDEFDVSSELGRGTVVRMKKWLR